MFRRKFLHQLSLASTLSWLPTTGPFVAGEDFLDVLKRLDEQPGSTESFWNEVRKAYRLGDVLDLNSAGLGMTNLEVNDQLLALAKQFNQVPSKEVNRFRRHKEQAKADLADLLQVKPEELALVRNATEALAIAINGIPLERGDEVIVSRFDYPHIYFAWKQRALRDGIILKYVDMDAGANDPQDLIDAYTNEVSTKTKAICITDLINWNGCQLPTEDILSVLPSHVRYRIVDAAQSLANTRDDWFALGATHVGASLHKWLGAPIGTGVLYVKTEAIEETWPLFASFSPDETSIDKFEHVGSRDTTLYISIATAIAFHQMIGHDRKRSRLIELSDLILEGLQGMKQWQPVSPNHSSLKTNLVVCQHIDLSPKEVHARLWKEFKIHCTTSDWEGIVGVRFSPNVFTSKGDVDRLINALSRL